MAITKEEMIIRKKSDHTSSYGGKVEIWTTGGQWCDQVLSYRKIIIEKVKWVVLNGQGTRFMETGHVAHII